MSKNVHISYNLRNWQKQANNFHPSRKCVLFDGRGGEELHEGGFVTLNSTPTLRLPLSKHFSAIIDQILNT